MLSYEDCLGLCDLSEEEIRAIAEHENLTELAALELGQYLVQTPDGRLRIRRMILEDIENATAQGHPDRALRLKAAMRHFVETHPENPKRAG